MSSANVELVQSIFACWERGDFRSVAWADPTIEYVIVDGPSPGRWRGLTGMADGWREVLHVYDGMRVKLDTCQELDDERVFALVRFAATGKVSGLELGNTRAEGATLFHLSAGRVTRIINYVDRDRALADLGLTPKATLPAS